MADRDYELVLVLKPTADEDAVGAVLEQTKGFISERGGVVSHEENWGVRRLAYPIQEFREGNYFLARIQLSPEHIKELDTAVKLQQNVIRHLLVKLEDATAK